MDKHPAINDRKFLKGRQYKTPANLEARIQLHARFGTNPYGWQRWVLDRLELGPGMRVLDAGCGPASLWRDVADMLPDDLDVYLGDLSEGMAMAARSILGEARNYHLMVMDVQALPLPAGAFDRVAANHMLYHVPDLAAAVRELHRVLAPGGRLVAATNGLNYMHELTALVHEFDPEYDPAEILVQPFCLENAADVLGAEFEQVEVHGYLESLQVTEVEPIKAYILSMPSYNRRQDRNVEGELGAFLQERLAGRLPFHITKEQGAAVAIKNR